MKTTHRVICGDARDMAELESSSVDLIVTSPPYPMIQMWDETFSMMNTEIEEALNAADGPQAFELMHQELDCAWRECHRVLKEGGIICINVGDATRTVGEEFRLYPNHSRVLTTLTALGLRVLPWIIWRKPTNAPNKFMGSGMLPPGAYVTLEHEFILIARKGNRRLFASGEERSRRRQSAYFWEERNQWFSDVWTDLTGTSQPLQSETTRSRSAAFPVELPYRLIQMFSIRGDTVLDPFAGVGTTLVAAVITARHSIGIEIEAGLIPLILRRLVDGVELGQQTVQQRYRAHVQFLRQRDSTKTPPRYHNRSLDVDVMTSQETDMVWVVPVSAQTAEDGTVIIDYEPFKVE